MILSSDNKRFRQRMGLGVQYVTKYLSGELLRAYYLNYSPVKPLDVLCDITYRCNLKCPTCFRWTSKPDENELGLKDWKSIILTLRKWIGPFNLAFGGGEPFMKKGLLDIVRLALPFTHKSALPSIIFECKSFTHQL